MIPVSTAISDPKWFHQDSYDNNKCFIDKSGVINGIREESLSPKYLPEEAHTCSKNCPYRAQNPDCPFILAYRKYLSELDFEALIKELIRVGQEAKLLLKFEEKPYIILLVHEAANNPCSERWALKDFFKQNGIELLDWTREESGIIF